MRQPRNSAAFYERLWNGRLLEIWEVMLTLGPNGELANNKPALILNYGALLTLLEEYSDVNIPYPHLKTKYTESVKFITKQVIDLIVIDGLVNEVLNPLGLQIPNS